MSEFRMNDPRFSGYKAQLIYDSNGIKSEADLTTNLNKLAERFYEATWGQLSTDEQEVFDICYTIRALEIGYADASGIDSHATSIKPTFLKSLEEIFAKHGHNDFLKRTDEILNMPKDKSPWILSPTYHRGVTLDLVAFTLAGAASLTALPEMSGIELEFALTLYTRGDSNLQYHYSDGFGADGL